MLCVGPLLRQACRRTVLTRRRSLPLDPVRIASVLSLPNSYESHTIQPPVAGRWLAAFAKKKKRTTAPASAGRVVLHQKEGKASASPKLCAGCGTVISSGKKDTGMVGGAEALEDTMAVSKRKAKKLRYADLFDIDMRNATLCSRCQALRGNNIWKAYDALRDVRPEVFQDQLKHIVGRRQFGLCVLVVDATDPEHSTVRNLRNTIGSMPAILVLNKIDLIPRINHYDQKLLVRQIQKSSTRFIAHYAVSAKTDAGMIALAEGLLQRLQGRDVFVLGAANVGKSSLVKRLSLLISEYLRFKEKNRVASKRHEMARNIPVTGSNLPGTTLQAVRIPCFASSRHALWDTPGIINFRALQYSIFPAHLMEPLTQPGKIEVPSHENGLILSLRAGYSLLIEAPWMLQDRDPEDDSQDDPEEDTQEDTQEDPEPQANPTEQPCVLARLDVHRSERGPIHTNVFIHPALSIRVVPTSWAPSTATIPPSHIERVKSIIARETGRPKTEIGLKDEYSLPLKPFVNNSMPNGELTPGRNEYQESIGKYTMDISFASLGWISLLHEEEFCVVPHSVKGSVFSKRRSLYPVNLAKKLEENGSPEHEQDIPPKEFDMELMRRLRAAAKEGRHNEGPRTKQFVSSNDAYYAGDEFYGDDEFW